MTKMLLAEGPRAARPFLAARIAVLWPWLAVAVLFAAAIMVRHVVAANTDVSWLLTTGERVLDGKTLYRDVIETNPPIAVWVYMPALVVARTLGVAAETIVDAMVLLAAGFAMLIATRILPGKMRDATGWPPMLLALAILIIMPAQSFAQREHIALIALLPALAMMIARADGATLSLSAVSAAGVSLGIALAFKPYFAIAILFGAIAVAVMRRSRRMLLLPELFLAGAIVGLYALGVAVFTPDYFTLIGPLVRDVYIPVGLPLGDMLLKPAVAIWALAFVGTLAVARTRIDAVLAILLSVSSGFAIVYLIQRKGWPYHSYPMLALALAGLGYAVAINITATRTLRIAAALLLVALFARAMLWFDLAFDARPLQDAVARLGPHPVVLAITGEPGLGHPLVRALGGTWVSRQQALWVTHYGDYMRRTGIVDGDALARVETYAAQERRWLVEDIARTPPSVVLVDNLTGEWSAWLQSHPDISAQLRDYRRVETVNGIDILAAPAKPGLASR